jgi:hypothetical protein
MWKDSSGSSLTKDNLNAEKSLHARFQFLLSRSKVTETCVDNDREATWSDFSQHQANELTRHLDLSTGWPKFVCSAYF